MYHDLVPAEVEEDEFWKRYFFWKQDIAKNFLIYNSHTKMALSLTKIDI